MSLKYRMAYCVTLQEPNHDSTLVNRPETFYNNATDDITDNTRILDEHHEHGSTMKTFFGRNQRNYPDHHNPDFSPPYYANKASQPESNISHMPEARPNNRHQQDGTVAQRQHATQPANRARSTLDALQIIRRRFEEARQELVEEQQEDQAAA